MLRIKELRLEKGITQNDLAKSIGVTGKSVWAYENKIAVPPLDVLIKLANFFQCSLDYLCGRSDDFGNVILTAPAAELTKDEKALLALYRTLSEKNRMRVTAYAEIRSEEQSDKRR